jgi:hypothetical protein
MGSSDREFRYRNRLRALLGVDELVGAIADTLLEADRLDSTCVPVYMFGYLHADSRTEVLVHRVFLRRASLCTESSCAERCCAHLVSLCSLCCPKCLTPCHRRVACQLEKPRYACLPHDRRSIFIATSILQHPQSQPKTHNTTWHTTHTTNTPYCSYMVYTSDHGFHLGEMMMPYFKGQPYDTDLRVPFMIRGPGIAPGSTVSQVRTALSFASKT